MSSDEHPGENAMGLGTLEDFKVCYIGLLYK